MIYGVNILDIILILLLLTDIVRGTRIGFVNQFFSFIGGWGGLFVAALVAPFATPYGQTAGAKLLIILAVLLVISAALGAIGEYLGTLLLKQVQRLNVTKIDAGFGGLFGAILVILSTWIVTAMLMSVPLPAISNQIQTSRVVRVIDTILPPAPPIVARIQRLINLNGFPQVFVGPEPTPFTPAGGASDAEIASAVAADKASVVKIEGIGCGGEVFGSGFIADSGFVVTNAHVVAGISQPQVVDSRGIHRATPVYFDPNLDIAVLRVSGLVGRPLPLTSTTTANGQHSIVLGYPGGGPFTAAGGSVLRNYIATGRNIYDAGITARQVYEISADVEPGNSGGPLVLPNGTVVGVVFARSQVAQNVGYALLTPAVLSDIHRAENSNSQVGTGGCAAG